MIARIGLGVVAALLIAGPQAMAQSRIKTMPGYDTWAMVSPQIARSVKLGSITADWAEDSSYFEYSHDGRRWRFDMATLSKAEAPPKPTPDEPAQAAGAPSTTGLMLARGRGRDADVVSPDKQNRAFSRDYNVWIVPAAGGTEKQISTDGSASARVRNGVGSYLYLEEFSVSQPVWWSPDGRKLAWMRYDESLVEDYFLPLDQTKTLSTVLTEAYPHPGSNNPVADLMVYDLDTGVTTKMDMREGKPFTNDVVGHYAWAAQWTKDGSQILIRRADRLQKNQDLAACLPATGVCRSIVKESRPQAWASATAPRFLEDGKRIIWISERTDFRNLYLYDLSGKQLARLTNHKLDVSEIVSIDEKGGWVWYTARSGDNHMKLQLHRVRLNGSGDKRVTDPAFTHRVDISPDGKYFVDVAQAHDIAPTSVLRDADGRLIADITQSDMTAFDKLGLRRAELFVFTSADGKTPLHGLLQFPSSFDPSRKYPVLVSVYGGPNTNGASEVFSPASSLAEYGFLVLRLDARTAAGKGRKILDTVYQQLGVAEMDDIAAGIRSLRSRAYVDPNRVGIFGTSYGGTTAATVILRHPDVVQAAVSNSPVTDYRLYDTAYSERFLGLPQASPEAYDRAAVLTYADRLQGDLLIYYGTSDDNVHPKNSLQFIKALQAAGKSFEVQVGPDRGHTGLDQTRMMEFFIQHLVIEAPPQPAAKTPDPVSGPNP
ncbi:MAG: DPP IV N-terminal domain-containing protein [Hyphomonadaceae bacterium]|nr:DPP IV N-terminal domain-containing protein [Hyphomonadaceae bacterium]